ncbi:probable serine/threonine-protein kinase SIS8 [Papaver somniferum]|uniref:probable serine/threonine-protein kinase SIS8 n=1 Tax=Papaver somniferum TaxID=3469 RepID=UPI000E6F7D18|nr:probable serine/threonine-protein kinase SIS8 [Papaver somniferum]
MDIPLEKKIRELEAGDDNLKESMSQLILQANITEESRSSNPRRTGTGVQSCEHSEISINFTNKQYLNILQSMGQGVHIIDQEGLIVYWNKAAEQIFGYPASEAVGKNINGFIIEEQDINAADEIIQRNFSGENWTGIFPARKKHGRHFEVLVTTAPLYDDSGTFVGIICVTIAPESIQETTQPISLGTKPLKDDSFSSSSWLCNSGPTTTNPVFEPLHNPLKSVITSTISKLTWRSKNNVWTKMKTVEAALSDHRMDTFLKNVCPRNAFGDSRVKGISWSWKHQQILQVTGSGNEVYRSLSSFTNNASSGNEVYRSLSSYTNNKGTSTNSSSSITRRKFYMERDFLNYDISLNNLTFGEQLGRGSYATVYRGQWCGTDVAIKVPFNFEYSENLLMQHSFRQEVLLMKRLRHPNVVLFMGAVTSPKNLCIVTEFLSRGSLFQLLRRHTSTTLDSRRRVLMALDIARGMNYLHRHNPPIIHRDLKSSNLLVDKNWKVKVGDFGLSRLKYATFLTTSAGNGTPQWMAPEVIRNEPEDEKSDVYSFGVVLWELATLKIPWNDMNSMQVIAAVGFMNQRNEIPKDTDPLWASLIERCWHSDPKCRPTFKELLGSLKDLQRQIFGSKRERIP